MQKNDLVLRITSPAPLRANGILLCVIALAFLASTIKKNADNLMTLTLSAAGTGVVILLFTLLSGAVLFKNIFGKEEIVLVKDGAPAGTAAAYAIVCSDMIAVERKPFPSPMTAEYKMAMLGLGGETLTLFTKTAAFPFGSGFSDAAATVAIQQMEEFCGRPLLRPATAAQR